MIDLNDCNIKEITSSVVCGADYVGKWFCSMNQIGQNNHVVNRYLQLDGKWGKTTCYFDSEQDILDLLKNAEQPDFQMSSNELYGLDMMRTDCESAMFDSIYDDQFFSMDDEW